jgi:hypothetical protein
LVGWDFCFGGFATANFRLAAGAPLTHGTANRIHSKTIVLHHNAPSRPRKDQANQKKDGKKIFHQQFRF